MFNPTPQRAAPQAWAPNPVLQPVRPGEAGFAHTDWANVPRVDYRTEKFRQLAIPDPARVVDDAGEFEPWQPKQIGSTTAPDGAQAGALTDPAAHTNAHGHDGDGAGEEHRSAEAKTHDDAAHEADPSTAPHDAQASEANPQTSAQQADTDATAGGQDGVPVDASGVSDAESALSDASDVTRPDPSTADDASQADAAADVSQEAADPQTETAEPGLDSAAVQQACDAARREGLEQGQEEGRAQGREEAQAQARQELQDALEKAQADQTQALQQLREELEGEIEPIKRQLKKAAEQVESLIGQPDKLYEHIKRLSLHLAEQLVLGELNMSSAAIERLIQRCLDELDLHGNHVVTVELNPQDKARLQERAGELSHTLSLQAVQSLQPGSVRVMVNDTMVEDLVGNRLDALARGLLVQPEVWREQSPFFRQPLAQRDTDIQDAAARVVASRESAQTVPTAPQSEPSLQEASATVDEVLNESPENDNLDIEVTPSITSHEPTERPGESHD